MKKLQYNNYVLFKFIKGELKNAKINFYVGPGETIKFPDDRSYVSGYWDSMGNKLAVAGGQSENCFITTLAHEYCHFLQEREKAQIVKDSRKYDCIWDWLEDDPDHISNKILKSINVFKDLELDCERRTVKLLKQFNCPINTQYYCKQASAYVYYYTMLPEIRRWFTPYEVPYKYTSLIRLMPTNLKGTYRNVPNQIRDIYLKKYC